MSNKTKKNQVLFTKIIRFYLTDKFITIIKSFTMNIKVSVILTIFLNV